MLAVNMKSSAPKERKMIEYENLNFPKLLRCNAAMEFCGHRVFWGFSVIGLADRWCGSVGAAGFLESC
jgi:hypothetical protein